MNNPRILVVPDNSGSLTPNELKQILGQVGFDVIILDELAHIDNAVKKLVMEHHFPPKIEESILRPKSDFELRQEWLNGFRQQHQKRARRSRK